MSKKIVLIDETKIKQYLNDFKIFKYFPVQNFFELYFELKQLILNSVFCNRMKDSILTYTDGSLKPRKI